MSQPLPLFDGRALLAVFLSFLLAVPAIGGLRWRNSTRRRLTAVWPNGSGIRLELRKTWQGGLDPTTRDEQSIEVAKVENKSWPDAVGDLSTFADRQADAGAALDLARQITGNGVGSGIHQSPWFRESAATSRGPFGPPRSDGYTVAGWVEEDPPYPGAQGGGMAVRAPYEFVVDGPTGALEWLQVNRTRLPVIHQVGT